MENETGPTSQPNVFPGEIFTAAFQAVEITSSRQSATTVRLAGGIEIELGDDLRVVGAVVKQLLEASSAATRAAGGRSC